MTPEQRREWEESEAVKARLIEAGELLVDGDAIEPKIMDRCREEHEEYIRTKAEEPVKALGCGQTKRHGCDPLHHDLRFSGDSHFEQ